MEKIIKPANTGSLRWDDHFADITTYDTLENEISEE